MQLGLLPAVCFWLEKCSVCLTHSSKVHDTDGGCADVAHSHDSVVRYPVGPTDRMCVLRDRSGHRRDVDMGAPGRSEVDGWIDGQ